MIDASTAVIYVKDLQGRYLLINRRFEELFHISCESAVGKTDHDLFPAERAAAFRAFDQRVLAAGATLESEEIVPQDDGLHTYISLKCPLCDESGRPYAVCGISTDITARKHAEEGWRASEKKYRSLYDNTPVMMHSIDREGRLVSVSNLWLETLGYERAEVIGRRSVEFLTPESRRFAEQVVLPQFFQAGQCKDVAYRFVKKSGEAIDVLLSAIGERDGSGNMVRSLAVLTDVSERVRAEEKLRRMAAIVESTGDAIVSVTPDRIVTSWNRGAEKVYGYSADEMIGQPVMRTIPPERTEEGNAIVARVLRGEVIDEFETVRLRKGGSIIPVALTVSPVVDANGAVVGIASIARDITRRKAIEAALRESEQRFRDFAETASDWFWETGPDHRFTFVSAPSRVLEEDRAARLGARRIDCADDLEDDPEKWRQHMATLERQEPFRNFVYRTRRRNGVISFVLTSGKPRFDASGRFLGYRGSARDITHSVRANEALQASEQRFRDFAETESDWLWETGPDHRITWMTRRTGAGRADPSNRIGKRRWEYAADVENEPEKWRQHRAALDQRQPFRDFVFRIEDATGERYVATSGKPVYAPDGAFLGYRGVGRDVTDAVRAERALRESEERLELAIEAGQMGTWDYDIKGNAMQWSSRLARLFGTSEDQTTATLEEALARVHPDDRSVVAGRIATALERKSRFRDEFRISVAGDEDRWVGTHGIVVTDDAGKPVRMVGVVQDITERKRAEARQKLLLDELNHRVKNTLVTVQSVAMQMAREAGSPELFYQAFKARLIALANAHDLLTGSAWQGASLRELLQRTVAPYMHDGDDRVALSGPDIWLKPNVAVGLAMAFQELATNATKHGALSAAGGRVAVIWRKEADRVEIRWSECGGPKVTPPRRRGFGSRLLERGLAHELRAEVRLNFAPAGLECLIRLPI